MFGRKNQQKEDRIKFKQEVPEEVEEADDDLEGEQDELDAVEELHTPNMDIDNLKKKIKELEDQERSLIAKKEKQNINAPTRDELKDMVIGNLDRAIQLLRYL